MFKNLHIVDCNISYGADANKIAQMLQRYMIGDYIITLQEVSPNSYEKLYSELNKNAHLIYSLEYRKPGKFDGRNRMLGALIIASKNFRLVECGVFERTLFPDRTVYATFALNGEMLKVASIHGITGCDYNKAKSVNFNSLAEMTDDYRPDIVSVDANEPKVDHYEVEKMIFYDKHGNGARNFFTTLTNIGLADSYAIDYDPKNYIEGEPLTVSHVIRTNKRAMRYDFVFINQERIAFEECVYDYKQGCEASADHAIIKVNCAKIDMDVVG